MSNYPDDIRDFDNHPGSPFYVEPLSQCDGCEDFIAEDDNHNLVLNHRAKEVYVCDYCLGEDEDYIELDK